MFKPRWFTLVLLLAVLLSAASCGADVNTATTTSATVVTTTQGPASFALTASYDIVMGSEYRTCDEILNAGMLVKRALKQVCGINAELVYDGGADDGSHHILIGNTAHSRSTEYQNSFSANDYGYCIDSEEIILIGGGNISAVYQAAVRFCADILGFEENSGTPHTVEVLPGTSYTERDEYPYAALKLQGLDLADFTIAYANRNAVAPAHLLMHQLGSYTGYAIPIVKHTELSGAEKGVIVVGALTRDGKKTYKASFDGYRVEFNDEANGGITIGIAAKSTEQYANVINLLLEAAEVTYEGESVRLSIPKRDLVEYIYPGIPQWTLKKETEQVVADGVMHITRIYTDEEGLPYLTHALIVDPAKATLTMGTAGDQPDYTTSSPKRVPEQMQAAVANGKNVIAGINADFFAMGGDNHPSGLTVKDGKLITKGEAGRPYFAVTATGEVNIGRDGTAAKTAELQNAWGGSNVIVENGAPADVAMGGEFGTTNHPRTLIGVTEDGKYILATIDGRQPAVSNGASLARCAIYMLSLGAETAVNLDGGGSTTMTLRNGDTYTTVNSPSGGALRRVYNSVLVVAK